MFIKNRNAMLCCAWLVVGGALTLPSAIGPASAHEYEVGKLKIEHPWVRTPNEGETTAPLYMHIENKGDAADKLIGVKSNKVGKVEIYADPRYIVVPHGIVVPPHASVMLEPGGPHVNLHDVKKINPVGWGFEMILVFEKAGEVTIDAAVEAPDAKHAHDAEAMERWEKAHPSTTAPTTTVPPAAHDMHDGQMDHNHMNHDTMDHGATTPTPAPAPAPAPTPAPSPAPEAK